MTLEFFGPADQPAPVGTPPRGSATPPTRTSPKTTAVFVLGCFPLC